MNVPFIKKNTTSLKELRNRLSDTNVQLNVDMMI